MGYDIQGFDLGTEQANADLSAKQFTPVKIIQKTSSLVENSGAVAACSSSGEFCAGILQNKPKEGEAASVRMSGVSKAVYLEDIDAGEKLAAAVGGVKVADSGDDILGQALEDGVAGDVKSVLLVRGGIL